LGKGVKIRTGDEVWIPVIEHSKQFGAKVLHFDISKGRKNVNEVVVDISGVTEEEWRSIKNKFLFIEDEGQTIVESPAGSVIIDGVGHIFVDGIWVCRLEKLKHGYDFRPADTKLDRDRRLMESWEAHTLTARAWEALYLRTTREFCDRVDAMLADNVLDVEHFRYDWCVGMSARKMVADRFREKFGEKAVPVRTESEAREIEFYGRHAAVVDAAPLRDLLEREIGTIESVKRDLADEITAEHTAISLEPLESKNFMMAMEFVSKAIKRSGLELSKDITIVEFRSPTVMGMRKDNKIYLSRNTLGSFEEALKTLVEEVAHEAGADATHNHVEKMHDIYASGVAMLLTEGPGSA